MAALLLPYFRAGLHWLLRVHGMREIKSQFTKKARWWLLEKVVLVLQQLEGGDPNLTNPNPKP